MMQFSALQTPLSRGRGGGRERRNYTGVVLVRFWGLDLRHFVKVGRGDVTKCLWLLQAAAPPALLNCFRGAEVVK